MDRPARLITLVTALALWGLGACGEDPAQVAVGHSPVIGAYSPPESSLTLVTGQLVKFRVDATDPDGDALDVRYSVNDSVVASGPRWTYLCSGSGPAVVTCVVSDGEHEAAVSWAVDRHRANRAPTIVSWTPPETSVTVEVGNKIDFSVAVSDPDGDKTQTFFRVGGLLASEDTDMRFQAVSPGRCVVDATVWDGEFAVVHRWTVSVVGPPANHPPSIVTATPPSAQIVVVAGTTVPFAVTASDPDGDALTFAYRVDGDLVGTSSELDYAPDVGEHAVEVTVSDGELTAVHSWTVTATMDPNSSPVIEDYSPRQNAPAIVLGQSVDFFVVASDPEGDRLSFTWTVDGAAWGSGTRFRFDPTSAGTYAVEVVVSDGELSAEQTWQVQVDNLQSSFHGRVLDAVTGAPIAGVTVGVNGQTSLTIADGTFSVAVHVGLGDPWGVSDDPGEVGIGTYFDFASTVASTDVGDLFLLPNADLDSAYYPDFYVFYRSMTDVDGIPPSTQQRRWTLPIDVYVPEFSSGGLDYRATIVEKLASFDELLDTRVYRIVDTPPETGVSVTYVPDLYADNYRVTEWTGDYYPQKGLVKFRTVFSSSSVGTFRQTISHEFGHALGLHHSGDRHHLMVGGTVSSVDWFSNDEILVIKALYRIPRGHDMRSHIQE